jgi:uncharacterized protein (DUF2147 family)
MKKLFFALAALSFSSVGEATNRDSIKGLWILEQDHTIIEMSVNNDLVEGKIYSRPGNRTDEIDKFNPVPELRKQNIVGLKVLKNLKNIKADHWKGGDVYDPDSGSTYNAQVRLKDPDTLIVRGYIGIPLFGRTAVLKRYPNSNAR